MWGLFNSAIAAPVSLWTSGRSYWWVGGCPPVTLFGRAST
uniref:Uncharacterized protein n=1 Tax=Anguilla anguilla TaxID=7936 RepID=A0A0E9QID8_ANGAN